LLTATGTVHVPCMRKASDAGDPRITAFGSFDSPRNDNDVWSTEKWRARGSAGNREQGAQFRGACEAPGHGLLQRKAGVGVF
jgi:hypothetical protein